MKARPQAWGLIENVTTEAWDVRVLDLQQLLGANSQISQNLATIAANSGGGLA